MGLLQKKKKRIAEFVASWCSIWSARIAHFELIFIRRRGEKKNHVIERQITLAFFG